MMHTRYKTSRHMQEYQELVERQRVEVLALTRTIEEGAFWSRSMRGWIDRLI